MTQKKLYKVKWINSIKEVPQNEWDKLAKGINTPFLEWDWLYLMEISGSATLNTGWVPLHLTLWDNEDSLIAAAPLYLKLHSEGEYIYDQIWIDLAEKMDIKYYPRLIGMSPFTPVMGYKFLIDNNKNYARITYLLVELIDQFCIQNKISGCHFLHIDPQWQYIMENNSYYKWMHSYFSWENLNYPDFNSFLSVFKSNQRRNIKRELDAMAKMDIVFEYLTQEEITPELYNYMYDYYVKTCDQFGIWGCKYLTKNFFEELYNRFGKRLLFIVAYHKNNKSKPLGMSFCVYKNDQLYGRYWGMGKNVKFLHFNVCYYNPIKWAIKNKIKRFDPGIGGDHKKRRGFISIPGFSLHKFYDWRLIQIVRAYIGEYNMIEQEKIMEINQALPFTNKKNKLKNMLPPYYLIN